MDFAKIAPKFLGNLLNWNEFEFKIWSKSATDSFIALFPLLSQICMNLFSLFEVYFD